ncbi:MATE family efflux transporter [Massilia consociata]|uniref:MATE family efflux transporter n=1 Tax=Massilia consociata TaxID=760117 RepID=A0ABV6FFE2_9BURK
MSNVDFTSQDARKALLRFSLPMMAFSILDYLGMFIGLGWLMALTASVELPATFRLSATVVSILEAGFGGLLSAVYIYANQAFGRKDHALARYLINFGFGIAVVVGVLIALFGDVIGRALLSTFDVGPTVRFQTEQYLGVFWIGYVVVIVHLYGGMLAKMAGAISVIWRYKLAGLGASFVLTPLMIVLAERAGYDVLQATALALIASRVIGLVVLGIELVRRNTFPFQLGVVFLPSRLFSEWGAMLRMAGAETLNGFSLSLSFFFLFVILSYFEAGTLEAVTISQYLTGFFQTILMGVVAAIIPFAAQNAGNRNIDQIAIGVRWMTKWVFIGSLVVMVPFMLAAPALIGTFVPDPVMAARALAYIQITALPWSLVMASFPFIFAVIGVGDSRGTLLLTIWSMYICNLLPVAGVRFLIGDDIRLAAYAEASGHLLTFIGCALYYLRKEKQLRDDWSAPVLVGVPA